jgi:hypothetical protein
MTEILGNKGTPPKSVLDKIAETPYPALITSLACNLQYVTLIIEI